MRVEIEVPDEVRERLEKKAAASGMTLVEYFLDVARRVAAVPTREEMIERLDNLTRADIAASADAIRQGREERDEQLGRVVSSK
jgi:predicted DNA-binding protein